MAAKFASLTALLLLGIVANVAKPVFARAIEGRQVVSSVATVPAGTTAVPSSANVITVSICQPTTVTASSAFPSSTFAFNSTANGTAVSKPSTRVSPNGTASSFFSDGPVQSSAGSVPIESPTGSVPIESPTSVATNAMSSLWSFSGPAATYTPILASTPTGSPTTVTTTDAVTVSSVFNPASPSSVPAASVTTVYYDCGSLARPSVSPTSVEATATAVPTVSNIFSRE